MKFATPAIALALASGANAFVQKPAQRSKTSLPMGYLDDLSPKAAAPARAGIASYLDSIPAAPARAAGAGLTSYLDSVNTACNGASAPTADCAEAITDYMGALSSGEEPASSAAEGAKAIGSYLDNLAGSASAHVGGAGIQSYLSTVATAPERVAGAGIGSYLDSVGGVSNGAVAPSAPAVKVSFI